MKYLVMNLFLFAINSFNAMEKEYYRPGRIKKLSHNTKLVPCTENQVKENSIVALKCGDNKFMWGLVVALVDARYFVKDTPNSGRKYELSELYTVKPKLVVEK